MYKNYGKSKGTVMEAEWAPDLPIQSVLGAFPTGNEAVGQSPPPSAKFKKQTYLAQSLQPGHF
jgi:hypothetical protein